MSTSLANLINCFEQLPASEQREFTLEILRRALDANFSYLSDEELTLNAEDIFLELDKKEFAHDASESGGSLVSRSWLRG